MTVRKKIYNILWFKNPKKHINFIVDMIIILMIVLNIIALILTSIASIAQDYSLFLHTFRLISLLFFTTEYCLRIWVCVEDDKFYHPIKGRIKFAFSFFSIIDAMVVISFYLPLINSDLAFLRVFAISRVFGLLKLSKYSQAMQLLVTVFIKKKEELLTTLLLITMIVIISAITIFFAEHQAQPENFKNILSSIWWTIITITTVGYGDIYPITNIGKIVGSAVSLIGVMTMALPIGILSAAFSEEIKKHKTHLEHKTCPHCKKIISD